MSQAPDPNAVPHEGEEGSPPALPPQRYEGSVERPAPTTLDRVEAIARPASFLAFMLGGFVLDGWAWSWVFFLVPGILHAWNRAEGKG